MTGDRDSVQVIISGKITDSAYQKDEMYHAKNGAEDDQ